MLERAGIATMIKSSSLVIAALVSLSGCPPAEGATFTTLDSRETMAVVTLEGDIEDSDVQSFEQLIRSLNDQGRLVSVRLNWLEEACPARLPAALFGRPACPPRLLRSLMHQCLSCSRPASIARQLRSADRGSRGVQNPGRRRLRPPLRS